MFQFPAPLWRGLLRSVARTLFGADDPDQGTDSPRDTLDDDTTLECLSEEQRNVLKGHEILARKRFPA